MSRDTTRRSPPLLFLLASLFSTAFTNSAFFFFSLSINQRLCAKPSFLSVPFLLHPTMDSHYTLKFALLLSCFLIILDFSCVPVHALNIGVQAADSSATVSKDCSRKCESEFCSVPPFLRYGKYCGLLYSGCPGEKPCDGLDACCMRHDACVQAKNNDYLSQECSQALLNCMNSYKLSGAPTFKGNTCQADEVINVVTTVMEAALLAGRYLHRP